MGAQQKRQQNQPILGVQKRFRTGNINSRLFHIAPNPYTHDRIKAFNGLGHWPYWLRFSLHSYCTDEKSDRGLGMNEEAVCSVAKGLLA